MASQTEIVALWKAKQVIPLIKELRSITGWGLKESKDSVEAANTEEQIARLFNSAGSVGHFTPEKLEDILKGKFEPKNRIFKAVTCACDNWEILGYPNIYAAAISVLENLAKN